MLLRIVRWVVPFGLFVFLGWRLHLVRYWVVFGIMAAWVIYVSRSVDPTLMRERFNPAGPTIDRFALPAIRLIAAASLAVTVADVSHYHWSDSVPPITSQVAVVALVAGLTLLSRGMIANRFFSSAIRLQPDRGHRVVDTGPYAVIRHPGYAAMVTVVPAMTLALGSWWGAGLALVYSALILRRAAVEDRYLREHLDGYAEYARRVRFRLVPGLW
jgi:protein-S-isoprenylcysteine O-methyltransferase Ste14